MTSFFIDKIWFEIIAIRTPYIFMSHWAALYWASLAAYIYLLFISWLFFKKEFSYSKQRLIVIIILIPALLSAITILGADLLKIDFFAAAQEARSLYLWKIIIPILFAYTTYRTSDEKISFLKLFAGIGILLSLALKELAIFLFLPLHSIFYIAQWRKIKISRFFPISVFIVTALFLIGIGYIKLKIEPYFLLWMLFISIIAAIAAAIKIKYTPPLNETLILYATGLLMISAGLGLITNMHIYPTWQGSQKITELCKWIKENTNKNDVFLTEPFDVPALPIRLECERAVFFSEKDGAPVVFSRAYALEWERRRRITKIIKMQPEILFKIGPTNGFNYVISTLRLPTSHAPAFYNGAYFIYRTAE